MPTSRYFAYTTSPIDGDYFISVPGLTQVKKEPGKLCSRDC